ncbi:fungal-specific transcription factor domain-containing protein [Kalaharituber pfeilii]|nr:fungal-specific transcription factor domain-containing protein [Kalaharituber pfeilii]
MSEIMTSGSKGFPTNMSLGRVVDTTSAMTSRSNRSSGSVSDTGSPSETIAVANPASNSTSLQMNKSSIGTIPRRTSTIATTERQHGNAVEGEESGGNRQDFEVDGGDNDEQQSAKRRKVEDQMSSLECVYKQKKKPGLRAGIGRELEERLDRVERMLASHARILEAHAKAQQLQSFSNASASSNQSSPASPLDSLSCIGQDPHKSTPTNGNSYISRNSLPNVSQVQLGKDNHPDVICSPSTNSTAELYQDRINSTVHMDIDGGTAHHALAATGNLRSSSTKRFDPDLPSDDILYQLIDLYFAKVQPGCPILHRQTLLDSYFNRPVSEQQPEDINLLFAISAAALRFSTDRRLDPEYKKQFKALTKQKVIFNALENPSIQSLRAMIIIALDVVGSTNGPSGWGLLALTTRMAVHLGLNTEPSNSPAFLISGTGKELPSISTWGVGMLPEPKDWIEQEGRRRLFWMVYALDIYSSLGTSLDLTLDEDEIERLLPCLDELWDRNEPTITRWFRTPTKQADNSVSNINTLSSFSFLIEILGLLGRIHRFLRKTIDINNLSDVEVWQRKYRTLDKALTSWKYSLPMQYGNFTRALNMGPSSSAVDPGWALLHAAYNTAVIRLHSVAAYPSNRSSIFGPSYSAGQRCLSAVENIAALTKIVIENNMLSQLGSTFAFTLWVSARLLLVHASTTDYAMILDIKLFLDALHMMGRIYETAERYATILQRVLDELAGAVGEDGLNMMGRDVDAEGNHKQTNSSGQAEERDATPGATSVPGGDSKKSSCVAILADMRRTAYAVDVLISRQPNANKFKTVTASYADSGHLNGMTTPGHYNGSLYPPTSTPGPATPQPHGHHHHHNALTPNHLASMSPNPHMTGLASGIANQQLVMNNPHTFEYLDVFNWFNFPRVPVCTAGYIEAVGSNAGDTPIQSFASLPPPAEQGASDWLFRE